MTDIFTKALEELKMTDNDNLIKQLVEDNKKLGEENQANIILKETLEQLQEDMIVLQKRYNALIDENAKLRMATKILLTINDRSNSIDDVLNIISGGYND